MDDSTGIVYETMDDSKHGLVYLNDCGTSSYYPWAAEYVLRCVYVVCILSA